MMYSGNVPGLKGGEFFYNYDVKSHSSTASNVDWTVTTIYTGNAECWDVQNVFFPDDCTYYAHAKMYMYCGDGGASQWEWSQGCRYPTCAPGRDGTHMRCYAYGGCYQYNPTMGKYVVGTCHKDDIRLNPKWGWTDEAANIIRDRSVANATAAGRFSFVWENYYTMYNYEAERWDGDYYWDVDGMADRIQVT